MKQGNNIYGYGHLQALTVWGTITVWGTVWYYNFLDNRSYDIIISEVQHLGALYYTEDTVMWAPRLAAGTLTVKPAGWHC